MPRTIQLFVVCLMLCCLGISNQSRATEPPGEVDSVLYQSSLRFFRKGITAYRQKQYDSTAHYLKLATDGYLKANAVDAYLDGLLNLTTILHLDRQYASYFQYAQKTRREIHQRIGRKNVRYAKALNNLMSHYHRRGNNRFAITLLEEALVILNSIDAPQALFLQNYKNQATAYKRIGDYTRAVRFCEKSLELLLKDSVNTAVRDLAHAHNDIADICQSAGRFDQALEQYGESLRLLKDINVKDEPIAVKRKIRALHGFSRISIEKGELQKAKVYLVRAIALQKGDITYRLSFSYELQGRIWMAQGRADEALKAYQKSLALAQKYIVSLLPYDHARKKFWIAQAYQALGQRTQALEICQKTLSILSPSFQSESLKDNPSPDKFLSEVLAIDLLRLKGQLLKEAYEQKGDLHWLHAAKNAYETALNVIRQLRKSVKTAQSKTELSERTTAVYEEAIDIVFQLYHDTKEVHYKELAFAYAESNKALLLLENINEQLARGLKGLPDSLVERDKQLRLDIAFYEKKVLDVTGSPSAKDSSKIANWKGQLFDLRQAQERLTKIFELQYPHFYKLKYQQEQIDLSVIRQQLAERQQALIEYFFGDEKIYIFLLTETQMEVFSVAYSSKLNEQIEQLRQAVSSLPSDQELASNFEQYTKTAFALYKQLLAPALKQLPTSVSSLIIIPDYQLNHLPFELLLMNPPLSTKPNFSVKNLDYVLEHYTLSYDYSAIMHIKNRQRNSGSYRQGFVGLAPIFIGSTEEAEPVNCRATALKPLACNQQEVQTIQNLIGGQSLLGKQAHKNTFDLLLPSSQIVHLATHACIDENSLTDDKIFLADDYISKHDLFNSRTNAELVVLSACNTGSGQLLKGEGVMSLARGFIQAGSASCVLSRWSVDDCATAKIMEQFYRSLKEEVGRSEALRLSKLSYLQSAEKYYQHPFFWGAFTTYGQTTPLKVWRSGLPPWLLPSLGALVILLLWSVWKFRFSRPTH